MIHLLGARPAAGGSAANPEDLPDPLALWDATVGVTDAGSGAVSAWVDQFGNGYDLLQSTGSQRPTTGVDTINGLNVLKFDGGDVLERGNVPLTTVFTIYTVYKISAAGMLYEQGANAYSGAGVACYGSTGGGIAANNTGGITNWDTSVNWQADNAVHLIAHYCDGTHSGHDLLRDGTSIRGSAVSTGNPGSSALSLTFSLGARGASLGITGDVAMVAVYGSAHDATNRGLMRGYTQDTWGTP